MSVGVSAAAEGAAFHAPTDGRIPRWGSGGIVALRIDAPDDVEVAVARRRAA